MAITDSKILTGLQAAYTRQQQGTANPTDLANLKYAQGQGWKPPVAPKIAPPAPPTAPPTAPPGAPGSSQTNPVAPVAPAPTGSPTVPPVTPGGMGSQSAFGAAFGALMGKAQQSQTLQDQRNKMITQLYDRQLTPEEIQTLGPSAQQAVMNRDKSLMEFSISTLNDQIKGRADQNTEALGYMMQGYQADLQQAQELQKQAETRKTDAFKSFTTMIDKYPDLAAKLSPQGLQAISSGQMPSPQDIHAVYSGYKDSLAGQKAIAQTAQALMKAQGGLDLKSALTIAAASADPSAALAFLAPYINGGPIGSGGGGSGLGGGGAGNLVQPDNQRDPSKVIQGYDFTNYATDPNWGFSVQQNLKNIGQFKTLQDVNTYINNVASGSPVTAEMISKTSEKYGVPWEMLVGIMQQESSLGTKGAGAKTFNPGNVGNTGTALNNFGSWQAGVDAVGQQIARRNIGTYAPTTPTGAAAIQKAPKGGATADDIKQIADAIISGNQPPDLKAMYGSGPRVRAELQRRGYDFTRANIDWQALTKFTASLNSTKIVQLKSSAQTAYDSLEIVENLSKQLTPLIPRGQYPVVNKAAVIAAKNGLFGTEAQNVATQLESQISDIVAELGTVYKGGNSATDDALKLGSTQLSSDWTESQLTSAIGLVRQNLRIRLNSYSNLTPTTPGGASATPADELAAIAGESYKGYNLPF